MAAKKNGEIELPPPVTATCGCICRVVVGKKYPEVFVVEVCKRHRAYHEELLSKKELKIRESVKPKKPQAHQARHSLPPKRGRS